MMKQNKILMIVTSAVILIPMLAGLLLWDRLPEQVPTHFGTDGQPDGWSSRGFAVFGLPLILLALHWICVLVTSADPKHSNAGRKMSGLVLWLVPAAAIVSMVTVYGHAMGLGFDTGVLMMLFIGVMFLAIGNYLPKCLQNYTIGIKLPWTLADEDNWNRTHRLAGWIWMGAGILILASAFLGNYIILTVILLPAAVIPAVYSWLLWQKANRSAGK